MWRPRSRGSSLLTRGELVSDRDVRFPDELHLPAKDVTIWYTVVVHEGQEFISIQRVSLDT
jgi:hypothetical protein